MITFYDMQVEVVVLRLIVLKDDLKSVSFYSLQKFSSYLVINFVITRDKIFINVEIALLSLALHS